MVGICDLHTRNYKNVFGRPIQRVLELTEKIFYQAKTFISFMNDHDGNLIFIVNCH